MSRAILLISNFIFVANTTLTLRRAFTSIANRSGNEEQELIYAQSKRERLLRTSRSRHSGRPTVEALLARGRGGIGAQRRYTQEEVNSPGGGSSAVPQSKRKLRSRRRALLPPWGLALLRIRRGGWHPVPLSRLEVRSLRQMHRTAI